MEVYKVWHDEEYDSLCMLYPLAYFIGHQYRFKNTSPDDKNSIFPTNYQQTYSDLFDSDDLTKMNDLFRRYYGRYVVRKEFYTDELGDIKTYTLYNLRTEVDHLTALHADEWLVVKEIAEWYNEGLIDRELVYSFFLKRDGENEDTESGTIEDEGSRGAEQNNPYTTEKSYGTGNDARKTTDVRSGKYKVTDTGSRKPNDDNTDWIEQNKTESETTYPDTTPYTNQSTETGKEYVKTYGQLVTKLTRTFGDDGHINHRHIDETLQGFKNRDLLKDLPDAFDKGGLEWLHIVVAELARELVYMVLEV